MKCPKCGKQLDKKANFCKYCGLDMLSPEYRRSVQIRKTRIGLVALVLALIAGGAAFFLFVKSDKEEEKNEKQDYIQIETPSQVGSLLSAAEETKPQQEEAVDAVPGVGLHVPQQTAAARKELTELYWTELNSLSGATRYGLLDMYGDDMPEMIVQFEKGEYRVYYALEGKVLFADGVLQGGEKDKLLGNGQTLLVQYESGETAAVTMNNKLKLTIAAAETSALDHYTDDVKMYPVSGDGLLKMMLLGKPASGISGWIRQSGRDYYYQEGKPLVNSWLAEGLSHYYFDVNGVCTAKANEKILLEALQVQAKEFMEAVNKEDADQLVHFTESCKESLAKRIKQGDNYSRYYLEQTSKLEIVKFDDATGEVAVSAVILWEYTGKTQKTQKQSSRNSYYIKMQCVSGEWDMSYVSAP